MNAIEGYACRWCREFHEDLIDAADCCQPPLEAWICDECETVYYSEILPTSAVLAR